MSRTHESIRLLIAVAAAIGVVQPAVSATLYASPAGSDQNSCLDSLSPCRTVQRALDAASTGSTLRLAAGTYSQTVQFSAYDSFTVAIEGGWDAAFSQKNAASNRTALTGGKSGRALTLSANVGATVAVTIDGLTIEKSNARTEDGEGDVSGGGLLAEARDFSTLTLSLNGVTVSGNKAPDDGGGLRFWTNGSSQMEATLTDCLVTGNKSTHEGAGAEVDALDSSSMTVSLVRTVFTANKAKDGGGALDAEADNSSICLIVSDRSQFLRNSAGEGGGALRVSGEDYGNAHLDIVNSIFFANKAKQDGGAVQVRSRDFSSAVFDSVNSTQTANKAKGDGGGTHLFAEPGSAGVGASSVNDIFWANKGDDDLAADGLVGGSISWSVVGSMSAGLTVDTILTSDPLFVDAVNGDCHLRATSPAIDAGTCVGAPATDYEGTARPQQSGCDIGADEHDSN